MNNETYINLKKFPTCWGMDLIKILEKYEELEHIDFKIKNRFRLSDKVEVLPWKRNYWEDYNKPLQNKPYHKRLLKQRKKIIKDDEEVFTKRIRRTKE